MEKIFCLKDCTIPPSVNSAYKNVGKRRALTGKAVNWYSTFIMHELKENKFYDNWVLDDKEHLRGTVSFTFPDNRLRDGQNFIKLLFDGLVKGGVIQDDSQVKVIQILQKVVKGVSKFDMVLTNNTKHSELENELNQYLIRNLKT